MQLRAVFLNAHHTGCSSRFSGYTAYRCPDGPGKSKLFSDMRWREIGPCVLAALAR